MKTLRLLAVLLLLPGCSKPPPRIPIPSVISTVEIAGKRVVVSHFTTDPDRRFVLDSALKLKDGTGLLMSWDHARIIHLFSSRGDVDGFDVLFLDANGTVVEIMELPGAAEVGITSTVEATHALALPRDSAKGIAAGTSVSFSADLLAAKAAPMPEVDVAGHKVHVETSHVSWQRTRGLQHRKRISEHDGMLFFYGAPRQLSFWMHMCYMGLDIAYFDENLNLLNVMRMEAYPDPMNTSPGAPSLGDAQYVLEVRYGWFDKRGLIDKDGKPLKPIKLGVDPKTHALVKDADP